MNNSDPSKTHLQQLPALQPSANVVLRRTETTLGLLRDVVQESSAEHWYERGKFFLRERNKETAKLNFMKSIDIDWTYWRANLQLSTLVLDDSFYHSCLYLKNAYDGCYPTWEDFEKELSSEQWRAMRNCFKEHCYAAQSSSYMFFVLSLTSFVINDFDEAGWAIDNAIKIGSLANAKSTFYRLRGALDLASDNNEEALRNYKIARDLDPCNAWNHYEIANMSFYLESPENDLDVIDNFKKALDVNPKHIASYIRGGYYLLALSTGKEEIAIRQLTKAIDLDPKCAIAYSYRGYEYFYLEEYLSAKRDFDTAILLEPDNHEYYAGRGQVLQALGDSDGALNDYNHALTLNPLYMLAHTLLEELTDKL